MNLCCTYSLPNFSYVLVMLDAENSHCNDNLHKFTETVHKQKDHNVDKFCLAFIHYVQHASVRPS